MRRSVPPRPEMLSRALLALLVFSSLRAAAHEPGEETPPPARTAPVLLERAEPVYPERARKEGIGGTVSLEITVGADGNVADVKLVKGAGYGLDEAALEAARKFRFKAATELGKAVASTVLFDQRFVVKPRLSAEASAEPAPEEQGDGGDGRARVQGQGQGHGHGHGDADGERFESTVQGRGAFSAASASSIRDQDFELRPRTSPNDVLRVVPGLMAVQHQGGGKADQLFLRGFDADHGTDVGVFIDGIPVNLPSHAHGQGFADLHWIIPEAIERIDVVKGPYDVRWGDFSTGGAVNLVTRKRFDDSSVQLSLGGFPTLGCRSLDDCKLAATQRFVGVAAPAFTGWAAKLHPWIAFEAAHDDGPFENKARLRRFNLFAKVSYDLSRSTTVGMFFQAYGSEWAGSGQIPQREVAAGRLGAFGSLDPSEGGLTQRQMLSAFLRHKSGDSEFNATAYVTRYRLALWNDFTFYLDDPVNASAVEQDDDRVFSGVRADYHVHRHWAGMSWRTTAGVEARYDSIHVDRWSSASCLVNGTPPAECPQGDLRKRLGRLVDAGEAGFSGNDSDVSQLGIAGFLEEDVVFNRWFRLLAGLRADWFGFNVSDRGEALGAGMANTSGTAQRALLSPKASAVITPVPGHLDLYLNYGSGFHTNQAQVALADGQTRSLTAADGTASSYQVRAVPRLHAGEVGARVHLFHRIDLAGAFWVSWLENETVFVADTASFEPSAPTLRLGVDLEARARILDWLFVDFDLAQARATTRPDSGNGGGLALAPRLYMAGGVTVKRAIGEHGTLRGGLRFRYLADRPAYNEDSPEYVYFTSKTLPGGGANPDYDPARVTAAGYTTLDLYAAYRWRWIEVGVSIQNLLNSGWREAQFGNASCTRDETYNPTNPNFTGSGNTLPGTLELVNRCGYKPGDATWNATRTGVADVHFTPGVPLNLQLTLKASF